MTETRTVTVEREIAAPPEKVWRALTQPHLVSEWLMRTEDLEPTVGRRFRLSGDWGGVDCEMLAVEPHTTLSYRWDHAHEDAAFDLRSVVTFTLEPTDAGTRVRMEQSGFRPDQKQAFGGAQYGWPNHLANLDRFVTGLDQGGSQ